MGLSNSACTDAIVQTWATKGAAWHCGDAGTEVSCNGMIIASAPLRRWFWLVVSFRQTLLLKFAVFSAFVRFTVRLNAMLDHTAQGFKPTPSRFTPAYLQPAVGMSCKKAV